MMQPDLVLDSPVGRLAAGFRDHGLAYLAFVDRRTPLMPPVTAEARSLEAQLAAWFDDPAFRIDIPLCIQGTAFQRRVWRVLRTIPPGQVCRYGELAQRLGTSARAVGGACRVNPVPIVVPCHRVVAASGIGGFAGHTHGRLADIKRWLLAHEAGA